MILLAHLLFGAAIGSAIKNMPAAIILATLSHYFLDFLPHVEYNIEIENGRQRREKLISVLKIALDFSLGILLIFIFSKNQPIIYLCALFAILPDGLTVLNNHMLNKILASHNILHTKKIHFLKDKKISKFWRILTQVTIIVASILLLKC